MATVKMFLDLRIGDSAWNSFTHFFRTVKGYDDWSDDEIEFSYNNDDVCEFIEWLSRVETDKSQTFTIEINNTVK